MKLGIDLFKKEMFKGKKVGLITNPTGMRSDFTSTIDVINQNANLIALFSPEHGVRGNIQAGDSVSEYKDLKTNIIVYSLYGESYIPKEELINELDIFCIDIQDVGSRFYTYISTMAYCMQVCKKYNKKFVVFDRPNPINGVDVEGNILDLEFRSFIGYYPIVQRHGMTIGELALLFNQEYEINCDLEIIKMDGYNRSWFYEETHLSWVLPSPNIPTINSCVTYNATCIFEGTNISEGRGTTLPFEVVGASFIDPYLLSEKLNNLSLEGVYFRPMYYTPTFQKFKNEMCGGVQLHITSREKFKPVKTGWAMLDVIRKLYPNDFVITKPYKEGGKRMLELNTGCSFISENVYSLAKQFEILEKETQQFLKTREKYLLY